MKEKTITITETQFNNAIEKALHEYHEVTLPSCKDGHDLMVLISTMALHAGFASLIKRDLFGEEE